MKQTTQRESQRQIEEISVNWFTDYYICYSKEYLKPIQIYFTYFAQGTGTFSNIID